MKSNRAGRPSLTTLLLTAGICLGSALTSQSANGATDAAAGTSVQVGDATRGLLAAQRAGTDASTTPRPIPGEIATRSYQRYLKSFEREIPERFNSTVRGPAGSGTAR